MQGSGASSDRISRLWGGFGRRLARRIPRHGGITRDSVVFLGENVVFAEGEAHPVFDAEDAGEVGMAREKDAEHVEGFAFMPVGGRPKIVDGGNAGLFTGAIGFKGDGVFQFQTEKVIDDSHLFGGDIVDAGEAGQPVELESGVMAQEGGEGAQVGGVDMDARMLVGGECGSNGRAKLGLEQLDDFLTGHERGI